MWLHFDVVANFFHQISKEITYFIAPGNWVSSFGRGSASDSTKSDTQANVDGTFLKSSS